MKKQYETIIRRASYSEEKKNPDTSHQSPASTTQNYLSATDLFYKKRYQSH